MAAGDILGIVIGTDGWYADITIEGVATGGTYNFGLGANNDPTVAKLALTVVSLGFDDTGAATTMTRTVYGTKQVRKVYPNQAINEETASGGNTTVRVALSDYVYAKDNTGAGNSGTAVTATIASGLYTQGGTSSLASTGMAVTNNSTLAYPKVVGNWSWPGYDKRGASFKLRAVVAHISAQQARPVRCVKFTATDGTNTATATVTNPTAEAGFGDAVPVVEYVATLDSSLLTQGAVLTENFIAYPWIGDTASCLDTSAGTVQPTTAYGPAKSVCDKTGVYAPSIAVVDSVSGNDGTGFVGTDIGSPPASYATIAAALTALKTYNNANYSRNNPGGSVVYLKAGSHTWIGGTYTAGTTPDAWVTITRFPGLAVGDVTIASQSGGKAASARAKVVGVTWTAQSASGVITGQTHLWVDGCTITAPTSNQPPFYVNTVWYVTRCTITALSQGLRPFAATNAAPAIIRGNSAAAAIGGCRTYMTIGNSFVNTVTIDSEVGQTIPAPVNTVVAFNKFKQTTSAIVLSQRGSSTLTETHGLLVAQNLIEGTAGGPSPLMQIAADNTTQTPVNNAMVWNNTIVGERTNLGYNEVQATTAVRAGWSLRNNIFDDANFKADTFAGAGRRRQDWMLAAVVRGRMFRKSQRRSDGHRRGRQLPSGVRRNQLRSACRHRKSADRREPRCHLSCVLGS
jgi:hypothetical protein